MTSAASVLAGLDLLRIEEAGAVLHVRLARAAKRNAINDALVVQLHTAFVNLPEATRAVVLSGEGDHFCAGLDLSELGERSVRRGHRPFALVAMRRSTRSSSAACRWWRCCMARSSAVASNLQRRRTSGWPKPAPSTALPEGQRGLFVGGGGSARIPRLIGVRPHGRHDAHPAASTTPEAGAVAGLSQYVVADGSGLAKAFELANKIAANAPLSNYAVMHALPRIAEMGQSEGASLPSR